MTSQWARQGTSAWAAGEGPDHGERVAIIGDCARCWLKGVELDRSGGICGSCGDELRMEAQADELTGGDEERRLQDLYEDERAEAAYQEHIAEQMALHEEQLDAEERERDEDRTGSHGTGELIR